MKLPIFTIALFSLLGPLPAEDVPTKSKEPAPVAQSAKFEGAMGVMKVEMVQTQPTILFRVLMQEDKETPNLGKKEGEMHPISTLSLKPDEVPVAVAMVEAFLKTALTARQEKTKAYAKALGTLDGKKIDFTWMPWTGRSAMMCGDSLIFEEDGLVILKMLKALPPLPDKPQ